MVVVVIYIKLTIVNIVRSFTVRSVVIRVQ